MTPEQEAIFRRMYPTLEPPGSEQVFPELTPNTRVWLEELRSGRHRQGKRALATVVHSVDGTAVKRFCCLGVGQILVPGCTIHPHIATDEPVITDSSGLRLRGLPGRDFVDWLGVEVQLRTENREFWVHLRGVGGLWWDGVALTHLNDDRGMTFPQIADLIEIHGIMARADS